MPHAETKARNRAALLLAAREVLEQSGVSGFLLEEIAARAGLTKGAVYSLFGGKLELLAAVIETDPGWWLLPDPDQIRPRGTAAALESLGRTWGKTITSVEPAARADQLASELELLAVALREPVVRDRLRAQQGEYLRRVTELLTGTTASDRKPLAEADAGRLAVRFVAAMQGLAQQYALASVAVTTTDFAVTARSLAPHPRKP